MADKWLQYQFDNFQVDVQSFQVWRDGNQVPLEPKAFEVLVFFLNNQGRLVEKNELLDAVWNESFVTPNALTRVIAQLRKGLGDDAKEARYIETVPTRGYRFIAEVKPLAPTNGHATAESATVAAAPHGVSFPQPHTQEPPRPRKLPLRSLLLVLAVVLFSLAVYFWLRRPADDWISVRKTMQVTSAPLIDLYPSFSPDGQSLAYCTIRNGSFEIVIQPLTPGSREVQVTSDGAQNMQPTWSPDGKLIAYHSRQRGGIWVVPALGGVAQQLAEFGADPAWSPDGRCILFQSDPPVDINQTAFAAMPPSTIWKIATQGGKPVQLTHRDRPSGGHGAPTWSPDGKRLAFVSYVPGGSEVWTMSAEGTDLQQVSSGATSFFDPVYSSDGGFLFLTSSGGNFKLWRKRLAAAAGQSLSEPEEVANTGNAMARHLTLSPDGKRLAYSSLMMSNNLGSIALSPATGEAVSAPVFLTQDTNRRKTSPTFSPDGKSIVYSLWRTGAGGELWLMAPDGSNPRQLTAGLAGLPNWLPDGKQVAVVARDAEALRMIGINVETQKQKRLSDQVFPGALGRLSPDGKLYAFNTEANNTLNIATLPLTGGPVRQLTFDQELMGFPCWSQDGRWLAVEMKRGENTHLAILPREGGASEQLTVDSGHHWPGGWAADHDRIAFAGQFNGIWNVYSISRRTKVQKQLTNYTKPNTYVRYPVWSPLSNQIVYEFGETTGNIWLLELK